AMTYYGRWTYKFEQAHKLGAKGVLLIHDDVGATYGWSVVRNSWSNETFFLPSEPKTSCFHGWIDRGTAVRALKAVGKDRDALRALAEKPDFAPVDTGLAVRVRYKPTFRSVMAENVAGVIRGGAVSKDDRYVVLSAHYDHLGVDPSLKGDTIYNGAVDNAAASATLLALARRLAERSASLRTNVIILAPSAEEVGLLGSRAFVGDPPVPLDRMVANINLELVNVWGPTEDVFAIGAAESELDGVCARAAKAVGLGYIEEQGRENGFFFRSDQLSFARAGVPGVWLSEGPTDRGGGDRVARARKHYRESVYHTVGDQMSNDWDLRGAVELADWTEAIVDELGRGSSPPKFRPASAFAVSR
ncbi:MAG: M28 family peptidase, partial [Myxococcales bacterium]|nr:M28 family peptidase [Myxococcales bacterium]